MAGSRPGGFTPVSPVDVVPVRRLELVPDPACDEDVDVALQELSYLESREATINAACEAHVRLLRHEAQQRLLTEIDGQAVPLEKRRADLVDAILKYEAAHAETFYSPGSQSRVFAHGTIAWRTAPKRARIKQGLDQKAVLEKLEKRTGFWSKLARLFETRLPTLSKLPLRTFVRNKSEVNVQGIHAAWSEGLLNERQLRAIGFEETGGGRDVSVGVSRWQGPAPAPRAVDAA